MDGAAPDPERRLDELEQLLYQIGRFCAQAVVPGPDEPTGTVSGAGPASPSGVGQGTEFTLRQFLDSVDDLEPPEQAALVDAALTMIEGVYVHLPLKRAMHAVDPAQRLRILKDRVGTLSARAFHDEMITIFHALRDLHTVYILPTSYQGKTAFLPFLVEEYFEPGSDRPRYLVTQVRPDGLPPDFQPGVNLTHWNGIPIDRAVEINAEREAGSNADARHARGLESLTLRPMLVTAPPDEECLTVGYESGGQRREARVPWKVIQPPPAPTAGALSTTGEGGSGSVLLGVDLKTEATRRAKKALFAPEAMQDERRAAALTADRPGPETGLGPQGARPPEQSGPGGEGRGADQLSLMLGVDVRTEQARRAKKELFFPRAMEAERQMATEAAGRFAAGPGPALQDGGPRMPDVLTGKVVTGPQGDLAYIRIYTFMVDDADAFVSEFVRLTRALPQGGLIIDVRGNGGGNILAGERLLQVLTPQPIEPQRFHFINTPMTLELCRRAPGFFDVARWAPTISLAIQTGESYSQGFTLEPAERYNRVGQQYQGPVVLITDALCYSTTDIFSAGFQDHGIGPILGVHRHTGAGGANVWRYSMLQDALPGSFPPLPKGATFRVAVRRSTRVRDRAGVPVEDLGVEPSDFHRMTRKDILDGNSDLIAKAAQLLAGREVRSLSGRIDRSQPPTVLVRAQARNLSRVDVYQDARPLASADVRDDAALLTLPPGQLGSSHLELRGFADGRLAAVATAEP